MDEVPTLASAPMAVVRISLSCTSPTRAPSGAYSTLVALTEKAYAAGDHLRIAAARALLLGYGGPHHVLEARRVDGGQVRAEDRNRIGRTCPADVPPLRDRLLAAVPIEAAEPQPHAVQEDALADDIWNPAGTARRRRIGAGR